MATGELAIVSGGVLFQRLFYAWLIIIGLLCWPIIDITFGQGSYTYRSAMPPSLRYNLIYILTYRPELYKVIYGVFLSGSLLAFLNLGGVVVRGVVWVTLVMLGMSAFMVFNAGMMLAFSYAFFLMFFFPKLNKDWKIMSSNFSILGLRIQFLIVYVFAALYKWFEADWVNGDAVHFLTMLDHFTPEWLFSALQRMPAVLTIMNYVVLFYITLFPLLIWFRKVKPILFIVGSGFHLYTILFMNLFDFGSIMIMSYLLFIPKEWVDYIKSKLPNRKRSVQESK
ncbi:MAG: HTTM domain-containing protein [Flavobacteriales bacterium]